MNLIIDIGNTKVKFAVFDMQELLGVFESDELHLAEVEDIKNKYQAVQCIVSSVRNTGVDVIEELRRMFNVFVFLDHSTELPVEIGYRTPKTLGCDRIAAMVGASEYSGTSGAVVVDAGTAVTYDFLNEEKVFEGGNIAPGLRMRLRALHEFTGKLPLVDQNGDVPVYGYDTQTAIRSGVVGGICNEIKGFVDQIREKHPYVLIFLTGGDADCLAEQLKFHIFVDKNIVLKGLNRILNYNAEKK